MIKTDDKISMHFGVNYLLVPLQELGEKFHIEFQKNLIEEGLAFSALKKESKPTKWMFNREPDPGPLRVMVGEAGPQVGQILISASQPNQGLELFIREAQAACRSFTKTWPGQHQIIHRDVTTRHLYPTESEHAFKYLWEDVLGQTEEKLSALNRKVLGGGLRVVMPPKKPEDAIVELKIESFLEDPQKIIVETQFAWGKPLAPADNIDPEGILREVEGYGMKEALDFLGQQE